MLRRIRYSLTGRRTAPRRDVRLERTTGARGSKHSLSSIYDKYMRSKNAFTFLLRHVIVYYGLIVIGFSFLLVDNHSIADSVFLATTTFTTVGYGDIHAMDITGRTYFLVVATYGIIALGIFLGILADQAAEHWWIVSMQRRRAIHRNVLLLINEKGAYQKHQQFSTFKPPKTLMRDIAAFLALEAPVVLLILVLGIAVGLHEGWTLADSIYWTAISSFTIGLGDYVPKSTTTRLFCLVYLPFSVAVTREILGHIASMYVQREQLCNGDAAMQQSAAITELRTLAVNNNGRVAREDFVICMLASLHKIPQSDIDELHLAFDRLDEHSSGAVTLDEPSTPSTKYKFPYRTKMAEHV
ncbi:hypothetical protein MPSEU_000897600 [Mayamaea pseudoterrestris]|nr:hypothetical protein MPSEU_000897600 [Mayamaea pseudoterrestris]